MSDKRWKEQNHKELLESRKKNMLDRSEAIGFVDQQLERCGDEKPNISYIHGISGVGKSFLSEYLYPYIKETHKGKFELISLKLSTDTCSSEKQVAHRIYEQLNDCASFAATRYEVANKYLYFQTGNAEFNMSLSPAILQEMVCGALQGISPDILEFMRWDELKEQCAKLAVPELVNGFLSQFDDLTAVFFEKAGGKLKDAAKELIQRKLEQQTWVSMESFIDELRQRGNEENERRLLQYLLQDIEQWVKGKEENFHLVFLVDTFESRTHSSDSDWFISELLPALKSSAWILLGTEEPPDIFPETLVPQDHCFRMEAFGEIKTQELRRYLKQNGIMEEKDQDFVIEKSQGLPAAVQIFLNIYKKDKSFRDFHVREGYQGLFAQYFAKHLTDEQRKTLIRLSLFDQWDYDVFEYIKIGDVGDSYQRFRNLAQNSALVLPASDEKETYRIPDIVKKTIHSLLEYRESFYDAHKARWHYYSDLMESLNLQEVKDKAGYRQMEQYLKSAFQSAVSCYVSRKEFLQISKWCKSKQQELSTHQFWALKEELLSIYLDEVERNDHFRYDRKTTKENISYQLKMMRDLVWTCRKLGKFEKARKYSGKFLAEILERQGIDGGYVPFAFYQMGLMYYDLCQYETAAWFLKNSIQIAKEYGWSSHEKVSFYVQIAAPNMLGCILMDCGRISEAAEILEAVQRIREEQSKELAVGCSNLSRLYLQSAQSRVKYAVDLEWAQSDLTKAKHYLEQERKSRKNMNALIDLQLKSREIAINLVQRRLEEGALTGNWNSDIEKLEQIIDRLKHLPVQATKPIIMGIEHNIAVLYAWSDHWKVAQSMLEHCLEKKRAYYGPVNEDRFVENRSAIRWTREALEYMEDVTAGDEDEFQWNRLMLLS